MHLQQELVSAHSWDARDWKITFLGCQRLGDNIPGIPGSGVIEEASSVAD